MQILVMVKNPQVYVGNLTGVSYDTGRVLYRVLDRWFDGEDVILVNGAC